METDPAPAGAAEAGAELLDAPCGHGRIANALAARGFRVTGVDYTPLFLERARADAVPRSTYERADLRETRLRAALRLCHQLVHLVRLLRRRGNQRTLENFQRALRPGWDSCLIEQHNRDAVGAEG